jgi:HNH endonuclease
MLFIYPDRPHVRKHGPAGYTTYPTYKPWLRDEFHFRCVYCLERERWYPSGNAAFGVEHIRSKGDPKYHNLICDYENLLYACNRCNSAKRERMLLDPCVVALADHVRLEADGSLRPLTTEGNRLINLLGLNAPGPQTVRRRYLRALSLYQSQPDDPEVRALYLDYFGYPDDLPDLAVLRPESNLRPEGLNETYFRQRAEGRLPEVYF